MTRIKIGRAQNVLDRRSAWMAPGFEALGRRDDDPLPRPVYGMTETAHLAVARGVDGTTAGTGVTFNSVMPGSIDSEGVATFVADLAKQRDVDRSAVEAEFFQTARPSSLIKRFATVEEVANMIVYVCSPLATATNGAALLVNVGLLDDTAGQRAGLLDRLDDSLGRDDRLVLVLQVKVPAEVSSSLHSIQAWRK